MQNNARYKMDFALIPRLVKKMDTKFMENMLKHRELYMCSIFNSYYEKVFNDLFYKDSPRSFKPEQFRITDGAIIDDLKIMYIELPHEHEGSLVYCTAYAFVYLYDEGKVTEQHMFTIEKSVDNTTCIAAMDDGERDNLGEATGSVEGDIEFISKLYLAAMLDFLDELKADL